MADFNYDPDNYEKYLKEHNEIGFAKKRTLHRVNLDEYDLEEEGKTGKFIERNSSVRELTRIFVAPNEIYLNKDNSFDISGLNAFISCISEELICSLKLPKQTYKISEFVDNGKSIRSGSIHITAESGNKIIRSYNNIKIELPELLVTHIAAYGTKDIAKAKFISADNVYNFQKYV